MMVVVGGYNSSNTCHLAALVQSKGVPHLPHRGRRRRGPRRAGRSATSRSAPSTRSAAAGWLGDGRVIGITAGASTPNNKVGETIARICALAGVAEELRAQTG